MGGGGSDASVRGARGYKDGLELREAENKDSQPKMLGWDRSKGGDTEDGVRCSG